MEKGFTFEEAEAKRRPGEVIIFCHFCKRWLPIDPEEYLKIKEEMVNGKL